MYNSLFKKKKKKIYEFTYQSIESLKDYERNNL